MIDVRGLSFSFQNKRLFHNISLTLRPGHIYCLLGENGAGKSTFLKCLAGHDVDAAKTVLINGKPLSDIAGTHNLQQHLMFMPQDLPRAESFTCREFVATAFAREAFSGIDPSTEERFNQRIDAALQTWEMEHLANENLHRLSGGEWRRTQLAFAFIRETPFLILDEPDAHLDYRHMQKLANACRKAAKEERIIMMATHNFDFAQSIATDFLILKDGQLNLLADDSDFKTHLEQLFQIQFQELNSDHSQHALKPMF